MATVTAAVEARAVDVAATVVGAAVDRDGNSVDSD